MIAEHLFSLKGRRALVTGSSRGIGRAIGMLLGEAGAEVIFHGTAAGERLEATVEEASRRGIRCSMLPAELDDQGQTAELIEHAGPVDLLILNASAQQYMTVEEFDDDEFAREYRVNVGASFRLIQGFLPGMKERSFGRIVSVGSVNQHRPSPRLCAYGGTKAAQSTLIRAVARSCGPYCITANNIVPGVIDTDRNARALADPATARKLLDGIPMRRFGRPEDCAGAVLLLCSEAGGYINGADIAIDGGMGL